MKALLAANAAVDQAATYHGRTALFMAAKNGHLEVVQVLLAENAVVDQERRHGSALFVAAKMRAN